MLFYLKFEDFRGWEESEFFNKWNLEWVVWKGRVDNYYIYLIWKEGEYENFVVF